MKKFASILLSFIVLFWTISPWINIHSCSGKLISFSFYSQAKKCCNESCKSCKSISVLCKISGEFEKQVVILKANFFSKLQTFRSEETTEYSGKIVSSKIIFHKLYALSKCPLNILIKVFRI